MAWLVVAQCSEAIAVQRGHDMVPKIEGCAEGVGEYDNGAIFGGRVEGVGQDP